MEIPRSLLDDLTDAVNALSSAAREHAAIALDNVLREWDGQDVEALRELCLAALEPLDGQYSALAAGLAAQFYDDNRRLQGAAGAYRAVADPRRDPLAFEGAVRAIMDVIVKDRGDVDGLRREVLARLDADTRRAANRCVAYNGRKDPAKPRYARVPSGAETCGFCLMLSSFGFHYKTEEAASHAHPGCDCRVVPSFKAASVKGYDPDGMGRRYDECLAALGGRNGLRHEWNAMPEEERRAFIERHGVRGSRAKTARGRELYAVRVDNGNYRSESRAFTAYINKRMAQEIESRDSEWFRTGVVPSPDANKVAAGKRIAEIPSAKLTKYALSPEGDANKARAFRGYLGYTSDDADEVMDRVYEFISGHSPKLRDSNPYGDRYTTTMTMTGRDGRRASVIVGWIKEFGADKLRLTTIYVDE